MPYFSVAQSTFQALRGETVASGDQLVMDQLVAGWINHGVAGYLFAHNQHLAPELRRRLRTAYLQQWQQNLVHQAACHDIARACAGKVAPVLLKGMALLGGTYPNIGARSMADIDLLISPNERHDMRRILEALGFRKLVQAKWRANNFKCIYQKDTSTSSCVVELHERLFAQERDIHWQIVPLKPYPGLFVLGNSDMLVHLIGHIAKQHTFLKLSWLLDIHLLSLRIRDLSEARLLSLVKALKLQSSLSAVNKALKVVFATEGLTDSAAEKKKHPLLTADFLWTPRQPYWRYQAIKHNLQENLMKAVLYDLSWLAHKSRTKLGPRLT